MSPIHSAMIGIVLLGLAVAGRADDVSVAKPGPKAPAALLDEVVYKGIVGKALDSLPMDPVQRANLQRTNAVVSGTATGCSLSVWAGLTNPFLLVGGFLWGIWSALNIHPALTDGKATAHSVVSPVRVDAGAGLALSEGAAAVAEVQVR